MGICGIKRPHDKNEGMLPVLGAFVTPRSQVPHYDYMAMMMHTGYWPRFVDAARDHQLASLDHTFGPSQAANGVSFQTLLDGSPSLEVWPYEFLLTMLNPNDLGEYTETIHTDYQTDIEEWYGNPAKNTWGYNIEDAFLHENDGQPHSVSNRRCVSIWTTTKIVDGVTQYGNNNRWQFNYRDPGIRRYQADRLTRCMNELDPSGRIRGLFLDEVASLAASVKDQPAVGSGVLPKYYYLGTDVYPTLADADTYVSTKWGSVPIIARDVAEFLEGIRSMMPAGRDRLMLNISGDNILPLAGKIYHRTALKATGYGHCEFLIKVVDNALPNGKWATIAELNNAGVALTFPMGDDSGTYSSMNPTNLNAGNEVSKGRRWRLYSWVWYLLVFRNPQLSWFLHKIWCTGMPGVGPTTPAIEDLSDVEYGWWKVFRVNYGAALGSWYQYLWTGMPADDGSKTNNPQDAGYTYPSVFTGTTGAVYQIWAREFENALILFRPRVTASAYSDDLVVNVRKLQSDGVTYHYATDPYFDDTSAVQVQLPSGTWYQVSIDGTVTGPVTSVALRQIEAAVLIKDLG